MAQAPRPLTREAPVSWVTPGSLLLSCLHQPAQGHDMLLGQRDFVHQVAPKGK